MAPLPKVAVSLEPIYKDDDGNLIPKVRNIEPDLTHIYEAPYDPAQQLRKNLQKIDFERGGLKELSVQSILDNPTSSDDRLPHPPTDREQPVEQSLPDGTKKPFTPEDLQHMRMEISANLGWASEEVLRSMQLIDLLLLPPDPSWKPVPDQFTPGMLQTTLVTQNSPALPAALPSVKGLNAQVVIGTKDKMLRHASEIFQDAANRMAEVVAKNNQYWETAVRLRGSNWPLVAAPLRLDGDLPGHRKLPGSDRDARDFRIAYGLEHSPARIRKEALGMIPEHVDEDQSPALKILGPSRRLRVGLSTTSPDGQVSTGYTVLPQKRLQLGPGEPSVFAMDQELSWAQGASVEYELYDEILREASNLPSASARVSEKTISIDAAVDSVLTFELVDTSSSSDLNAGQPSAEESRNAVLAELIQHTLGILLIRAHRATIRSLGQRTQASSAIPNPQHVFAAPLKPPPVLGPVISLLQYDSFIQRFKRILSDIHSGLASVGMSCEVGFQAMGDDIAQVLARSALLSQPVSENGGLQPSGDGRPTLDFSMSLLMSEREDLLRVNGEASIRIGGQHPVRFTFTSPAVLTLHLPQATLNIFDEAQLDRFMIAEVGRCVLERLREVGRRAEANQTKPAGSSRTQWIVDGLEGTLVGDRGGGRIQVKIAFDKRFRLTALAVKTKSKSATGPLTESEVLKYPTESSMSIEAWIASII